MRSDNFFFTGLLLITTVFVFTADAAETFKYVSPKPNSILVSRQTNIIMRSESPVDESTLDPALIRVDGSNSGIHAGDFLLSDDGRTIVFNPYSPFAPEESVNVTVKRGIKGTDGTILPEYSFSFWMSLFRW